MSSSDFCVLVYDNLRSMLSCTILIAHSFSYCSRIVLVTMALEMGIEKNRTEWTEYEPMTASIFLTATAVICSNNAIQFCVFVDPLRLQIVT